jgi:hypothetical protein
MAYLLHPTAALTATPTDDHAGAAASYRPSACMTIHTRRTAQRPDLPRRACHQSPKLTHARSMLPCGGDNASCPGLARLAHRPSCPSALLKPAVILCPLQHAHRSPAPRATHGTPQPASAVEATDGRMSCRLAFLRPGPNRYRNPYMDRVLRVGDLHSRHERQRVTCDAPGDLPASGRGPDEAARVEAGRAIARRDLGVEPCTRTV